MASEITVFSPALSGHNLYVLAEVGAGDADAGKFWNGTAWVALTGTRDTFDLPMSEPVAGTGHFTLTLPTAAAFINKPLKWYAFDRSGATPSQSADGEPLYEGFGFWNGVVLATNALVSDGTGVGQIATTGGNVDGVVLTLTTGGIGTAGITATSFAANTGLISIRSNIATGGGATSITLDAGASTVTNFYRYDLIEIIAGTGLGQYRLCTAYDGGTKVATVTPAWAVNPASGSTFLIRGAGIVDVEAFLSAVPPTPTVVGVPKVEVAGGTIQGTLTEDAMVTMAQRNETQINTRLLTSAAMTRLERSVNAIAIGTVTTGSTTTVIQTSVIDPSPTVADQFKDRIMLFDAGTVTAALRGQGQQIIANTAGGQLTLKSALTTAPANLDKFTIT